MLFIKELDIQSQVTSSDSQVNKRTEKHDGGYTWVGKPLQNIFMELKDKHRGISPLEKPDGTLVDLSQCSSLEERAREMLKNVNEMVEMTNKAFNEIDPNSEILGNFKGLYHNWLAEYTGFMNQLAYRRILEELLHKPIKQGTPLADISKEQ